jgi:hypothetical protein
MSDRFERVSPLAGILAVALWVAGFAIAGRDHIGIPGGVPEEGGEETLAYFRENADAVQAGSWVFMIGSLLFILFTGVLRRRLLIAEGGGGTFAAIAFAGGVATGVFLLGMPAGGLVAALAADDISASTAEALNGVELVFFLGAELVAIVLLTASCVVSLRTHAFPRWWAGASIVLAAWLLIAPIGWVGLLVGVPAWAIVTAILLVREPRAVPAKATAKFG